MMDDRFFFFFIKSLFIIYSYLLGKMKLNKVIKDYLEEECKMNPLDEQNDSQIEETNRQTRKGKSRFRGWLTTLAGGIIGSVLTLTVVPYTPYFETFAMEI